MRESTRVWILVATALVVVGVIAFFIVMGMNKWSFKELDNTMFVTNTYDLDNEIADISINTDTADLVFDKSTDGKTHIVCYEDEKMQHEVTVTGGTLSIKSVDMRKWYEHIGVSFKTPKITISLPNSAYETLKIKESTGDVDIPADFGFSKIDINASTGNINNRASASGELSIKLSTGDITVENVSAASTRFETSTGAITVKSLSCAGEFFVKVSTGKAKLFDINCASFTSEGSTGAITMERLVSDGKLKIRRSTGNVHFEKCDAAEVFVETDTGNIQGSFATPKIVFAKSDTGRIDVPKSTEGGSCELKSDTGNIIISFE
ncbi:MAG: DUF4097 family beta strand repeat protein [Lachnospiraceae bacterium]|nr:DUF4097 family beta strand repeat protein [Lachnospiraceae bacterium]